MARLVAAWLRVCAPRWAVFDPDLRTGAGGVTPPLTLHLAEKRIPPRYPQPCSHFWALSLLLSLLFIFDFGGFLRKQQCVFESRPSVDQRCGCSWRRRDFLWICLI